MSNTLKLEFTQEEYDSAKARIERRLETIETSEGSRKLFPLRKNEYIVPTERLIYETIYGEQVANTFLERVVGIKQLIQECQDQSKSKGTVTAIDGRELHSRSPHSALNLLLQGSAGVIAKKWMENYHAIADSLGLINGRYHDFYQQAYIHDEFQVACIDDPDKIDKLKTALRDGAAKVTTDFNMQIPVKADATHGASWADTH